MGSRARIAVVALGAAAVLATAAFATRGRRASKPKVAIPSPAGGAASTEDAGDPRVSDGDGGFAVAEDARLYPVRTWSFALDRYEVRIDDVKMTTALDDVLRASGADLVVNGGFFDPKGRALGLAVSGGAQLSPLVKNLSGGVVTIEGGAARLHETESFVLPEGARFAVQCRPRLVVGGRPNVKSDDGKRSERSALCLRDGGRTIDVVVVHGKDVGEPTGPSLFALGRYLARAGCEDALNLDGGPSTGVAWKDETEARLLAPRGAIRHALVFSKK